MSTTNNISVDKKEEFHPTVLSQSFTNTMSSSVHYINNFWDTLVLQQQQQLDQTYNTFNKPIGNSSQDFYHESNPAAELTVSAPRWGIHDLVTAPILDSSFFIPFHQHSVIKDDVFLAQPPVFTDTDDSASISSHSSLSSFQHGDKLATSPCLSPVTLPTNFLYNHEPLFEGVEVEKTALAYDGEDEEYDDCLSIVTESRSKQPVNRLSTGEDLDWFKLLDTFREDVACDIPASTETTVEEEEDDDCLSLNRLSSESDMDDYAVLDDTGSRCTNKRKRNTKNQALATNEMFKLHLANDFNAQNQPVKASKKSNTIKSRQKSQKKANTSVKELPKKKMNIIRKSMLVPNAIAHIQKSTSNTKEEYDGLDQNKETENCHQLIETIAENEKTYNKTVFQQLTDASIDWCRYCGTTEDVNWRPGPWGKRTLCNKHGCDYKGYGLANRLPRLDLSAFLNEKLIDRTRPVVQDFCFVCQSSGQTNKDHQLIYCQGGCSRAYHQHCHTPLITANPAIDSVRWYCSALCKENHFNLQDILVVELPHNPNHM
ncbi:hypothetical protein INT46_006624 [Mucor plumbeus]|uniref:PHD-type domain-containing protein n=1 Tax=Mucor plumbeus TaxID=97098 RepID=A0A8H7RSU0_9FUNG|nr:hypothetical protein INT46_006624 [Mucor plumbeus]